MIQTVYSTFAAPGALEVPALLKKAGVANVSDRICAASLFDLLMWHHLLIFISLHDLLLGACLDGLLSVIVCFIPEALDQPFGPCTDVLVSGQELHDPLYILK